MLLVFGFGDFLPLLLLLFGSFLLGREILLAAPHGAKELVQHGEGSGAAVLLVIVGPFRALHLTEHIAHLVREVVQILLGEAHLLHCRINLGNSQTSGTFEAIALIQCNAVFHLGDENHGDILLTLGTQFRLHTHSLRFFRKITTR